MLYQLVERYSLECKEALSEQGKQLPKLIEREFEDFLRCDYLEYTLREPPISPFKPINRPLKTDWYNGTTYNRLF